VETSKDTTTSSKGKGNERDELNLPRDRVSAMKDWLREWEKNNKEHASKWDTATYSSASGQGGAYIPRTGARNQPFECQESFDRTIVDVNMSSNKRVSALTQWLDDFGQNSKAHFEKGTARPLLGYTSVSNIGTSEHDAAQDEVQDIEEMDKEEDKVVAVENTYILEEPKVAAKDVNMSMMQSNSVTDNVDVGDESDWEDDYEDLMMQVDIAPIGSADSWDKQSVESPRGDLTQEENEPVQENIHRVAMLEDDELSEEEEVDELEEEEDVVEGAQETAEDDIDDELSSDSSASEMEDYDVSTAHSEGSISKLSFEGEAVGVVTAKNLATAFQESRSNEMVEVATSSLVGEKILSKSCYGNRAPLVAKPEFTAAPKENKAMVVKTKKKGLHKFFNSLIRMLGMKKKNTSKAAEMYAGNFEETRKPEFDRYKSSKSLFLSPDTPKGRHAYLPNTYDINTSEPHDFARQMVMHGMGRAQAGESPMSLASAFRRQLSPDSSCISGFTDVEAMVLVRNQNIDQHIKHLQGVFNSAVRAEDANKNQIKQLCQF